MFVAEVKTGEICFPVSLGKLFLGLGNLRFVEAVFLAKSGMDSTVDKLGNVSQRIGVVD